MRLAAALALASALVAVGAAAAAEEAPADREAVDLELVLLADATGSIDDGEIRLQRQGYADALVHPEVLWAIANGGGRGRIALAYVEWAAAASQHVVVDWTAIATEAEAREFGRRLMAAPRRARGSNAIGAALLAGLHLLETNRFDGARKVIDLSADSAWNPVPPTIATARDAALGAGVVVNGLAILCRECSGRPRPENLEQQFEDQLVGGPGSFVITAEGREAFALAVRRKLVLEISGTAPASPG